jgi:putative peptidoglycan lipid II flippase
MLGLPAWSGVAGLTASAGIAGWIEFYLLRRAITQRIGRTGLQPSHLGQLWGSAIVAGIFARGVEQVLGSAHPSLAGALAMTTFALVYGVATVTLGVPEAKAIVARVTRR